MREVLRDGKWVPLSQIIGPKFEITCSILPAFSIHSQELGFSITYYGEVSIISAGLLVNPAVIGLNPLRLILRALTSVYRD